MYGIVSELPEPYLQIVHDIWDELEQKCGLKGIRHAPIPHFSWHVADRYDFDRSAEIIEKIATETSPFRVRTAGIALFTGDNPIIYISMVRTAEMSALHGKIWKEIQPAAENIAHLFNPSRWMPHISLAYPDVERDNLDCAMQILAFRDFAWYFNIDSLSLIGNQTEHEAERVFKVGFGR